MSFAANPEENLAGIIAVVIISIEQQCRNTGSLQTAILMLPLGSKKFVGISSCLSQNWSFAVNLTDKGRTVFV